MRTTSRFRLLCSICCVCFLAIGCTETKEDLLTRGNLDLWKKQPDAAIKIFQKVLSSDPNNADAHRGMANAYALKNDLVNREQYLSKAYVLTNLRPNEKQFFGEELERLYLEKAEASINDPAQYENLLRNALVYNEKSKAGVLLAKFYLDRGQSLLDSQKQDEAVVQFEKVLELPIEGRVRVQAESARDQARLFLLGQRYRAGFGARQAELARSGRFDIARSRWTASATVTMPPDTNPADPQLNDKAAAIGSHEAYKVLFQTLAAEAGTDLPEPLPKMDFPSWSVDRAVWLVRPRDFAVTASVSFDDGLSAMFFLQKIAQSRRAAAEAAAAAGSPIDPTQVGVPAAVEGAAPPAAPPTPGTLPTSPPSIPPAVTPPGPPAAGAPAPPAPASPAPAAPAPASPAPASPAPASPAPASPAPASPAPASPAPASPAPASPAPPPPAPAAPAPTPPASAPPAPAVQP
jgi:hypothetical protein